MSTVHIEVCVDCLFVLANGVEDEAGRIAAERMAVEWPPNEWDLYIACDDACEGSFSSWSCRACASPLGGDRHPVVAVRKE